MDTFHLVAGAISGIATSAVFVLAAAFLAKSWLGAKIKADVETTYAMRLESHRSELRAQQETQMEQFRASFAAFSAAHGAAAERRLDAVREIWEAALGMHSAATRLMLMVDLLTSDEIANSLPDAMSRGMVKPFTDADMYREFIQPFEGISKLRPFVEEPLWAAFVGYQALVGRILVVMEMAWKKGKLRFWTDDAHTRKLLEELLTPAEREYVLKMPAGGIGHAITWSQNRIVDAARETISGRAASEAALARARHILGAAERDGAAASRDESR